MKPDEWETVALSLERDAWQARESGDRDELITVCHAATRAAHRLQADWPDWYEAARRFACVRRLDRLGRRGVAASMAPGGRMSDVRSS